MKNQEHKSKICKLLHILSMHIKPILQVMNVDYNGYIDTTETKCLNTAIMIIIVLIGKKTFKNIEYCSVQKTEHRNSYINKNNTVMKSLIKSMSKPFKYTQLYYILITDGYLRSSNTLEQIYFPGHVLIIERNTEACYTLYQSYINKYDLKSYIQTDECTCYTQQEILRLLGGLQSMLSGNYVWDDDAVNMWYNMTKVKTNELIDYKLENIFICNTVFKVKNVVSNVRNFVSKTIKTLQEQKQSDKYIDRGNANALSFEELTECYDQLQTEINQIES